MKTILQKILDFIKIVFSPKYISLTFGVIIFILVVSLFTTCSNLNRERDARQKDEMRYQNNIKATTDSIRTFYDKKLDQMVSEKTSFLAKNVQDLKNTNEKLYNEFKDVKNLVAGVKSSVSIIIPTLTGEINKINQDPTDSTKFTIPFTFNYRDDGLVQNLSGQNTFKILNNKPILPVISSLTTNTFDIKLRYNVKEEKGKYIIQATSPSDLVKFTELDGVLMLDKTPQYQTNKSSRFVLGPYVGFGLNTDMIGQQPRFGWSVGFGFSYNIFVK